MLDWHSQSSVTLWSPTGAWTWPNELKQKAKNFPLAHQLSSAPLLRPILIQMTGTASKVLFVCDKVGEDTEDRGTEQKPLKSLAFAMFLDESASLKVRKTLEDGSEVYEEPSASAVKKSKKLAEALRKKQQKEEERRLKDAAMAESKAAEEAAKLERAKSIILTQDASLPQAIVVCFHYVS